MARRVAFLIGNQSFLPEGESGLLPLQGPVNDIEALAPLLRDPERGNFEVHEFIDRPHHEVMHDIAQALTSATRGDLVLIYYSGHGKLDRQGRLCLATADTVKDALRVTSIPAMSLRELVEESDCDQVVLLLDCCYSGAVDLRADVSSQLHVIKEARGFYIMTATTSMQAARETTPVSGGVVMGRFTAALVNGIESGAADMGRKGTVLISDLRRYLDREVTGQTPQFFEHKASGDPLISFSPATAAMAFLNMAREYVDAANGLFVIADARPKIRGGAHPLGRPLYFLYYHAAELALKAFLRAKNVPIRDTDQLAELYEDSRSLGLAIGPRDRFEIGNVVSLLDSGNKYQGFRYFNLASTSQPELSWVRETITELLRAVEPHVPNIPAPGAAAKIILTLGKPTDKPQPKPSGA